jgi:hypothetical protein
VERVATTRPMAMKYWSQPIRVRSLMGSFYTGPGAWWWPA